MASETLHERLVSYAAMPIELAIEIVDNAGPSYSDLAVACAAQVLANFARQSLQAQPEEARPDGE